MAIKNRSTVYDEKVDSNRAALEHRATWMGLTYDEALKAGADAEAITRNAIKRTGYIHGAAKKAACADPQKLCEFSKVFVNDLTKSTFQMDYTNCTDEDFEVEFHYCPLVAAWQKLGFDDETIAKLCDMAMDGDRAIVEPMGYKFELTETIAAGDPICRLHFHK